MNDQRQKRTSLGIWVLGLCLLSCANAGELRISPNPALMDERVTIQVTGLTPKSQVMITARSKDQRDCWWRSFARFEARADGSIDVSTQAPISASYSGVDAMGLFWSMEPDREQRPVPAFFQVVDLLQPVVTEVEVFSDRGVIGPARLVRHFAGDGVLAERIGSNGVAGILYRPGDSRKHPGVILIGGSEGGFPAPEGPMLASRGFVVLALAYFGVAGRPPSMQRIPMEYFGRAIHGMLTRPDVEGPGVTLIGSSRGAEAALIAGSMYGEVNGVVGVSSSNVVWEGVTASMLPGGPAWICDDKPLPYVPFHISAGLAMRYLWSSISGSPLALKSMFADSLERADKDDVQVAVERIRGPVLLASGGDDQRWPSAMMSARAMERLRRNRHAYPDEHVSYEGVGHWIPVAYLPTGGLRGKMAEEIGGTPEGSAKAQAAWWPKMLEFLGGIGGR
jgi:pimeloyl-ACP methyl ester carboxylesterase